MLRAVYAPFWQEQRSREGYRPVRNARRIRAIGRRADGFDTAPACWRRMGQSGRIAPAYRRNGNAPRSPEAVLSAAGAGSPHQPQGVRVRVRDALRAVEG